MIGATKHIRIRKVHFDKSHCPSQHSVNSGFIKTKKKGVQKPNSVQNEYQHP